jgi:CubicO group peptidase (beta-lactamase class C family)
MKSETQFSLGFMKPSAGWPFGSRNSFGAPGAGGSFGFADPTERIGYGYVTSRMGTSLTGDPRDVALRDAIDACCKAQRSTAVRPARETAALLMDGQSPSRANKSAVPGKNPQSLPEDCAG